MGRGAGERVRGEGRGFRERQLKTGYVEERNREKPSFYRGSRGDKIEGRIQAFVAEKKKKKRLLRHFILTNLNLNLITERDSPLGVWSMKTKSELTQYCIKNAWRNTSKLYGNTMRRKSMNIHERICKGIQDIKRPRVNGTLLKK